MARTTKSTNKKTKKPSASAKKPSKVSKSKRIKAPSISLSSLRPMVVPFLVTATILLAAIFWYYKIYTDPHRIFWGMVSNNLSTAGFAKENPQESGSFVSSETTQVSFVPDLGVMSLKDITDSTQQPPTRIKLEALGLPKDDYQHYALIDRPGQNGQKKPDYSKIYDLWLKSDPGAAQLINSNLFGPVLFGYLPPSVKQKVITDLKKAYEVNYQTVKKVNLDGRRAYSFEVEVSLPSYAAAAKKYAHSLGLPIAEQIDPTSYSKDNKTRVTIYIDSLSRQVRKVQYRTTNNFENYTGYGIGKNLTAPSKTVSSDKFQEALNAVSSQ